MRSIFFKILVWFSLTLAVCVAGLWLTNQWRNRFEPGRHDFFSRSLSLQVSDARAAYESGGQAGLAAYLARLRSIMPGDHSLVDEHGVDLLTGVDRSAELKRLGPHWSPSDNESRMMLSWPSRDGKFRMIIDAPAPVGPWSAIPAYVWIGLAAVLFCYILAVQFAGPLRTLEQTVEKFGRGDLAVRASAKRKDEFGNLARAFNVMAERIETLLKAERRLLQDVSHELRSPLARLEFAVELARTSPDQNRSLDRIKKEIDRLSTLVSELLQVTRAENEPDSRNMVALDLRQLVQAVREDSQVEADARRVTLKLTDDAAALEFTGDRELLRRAVENVVRNAIRYAPEGSSVDITLVRQTQKAVIAIRDFGPGVPPESLPHLFKPFFRAEADRNRNSGGGVGLGLSIAQRAVAVHNGFITAANAEPGLRVEISLPVEKLAVCEPGEHSTAPALKR
jgi:two-component system sensor histidine kinase CpxA